LSPLHSAFGDVGELSEAVNYWIGMPSDGAWGLELLLDRGTSREVYRGNRILSSSLFSFLIRAIMIQLTVGYVAGIIAAGVFLGRFKILFPKAIANWCFQREYGLLVSSSIYSPHSLEIEPLHQHGE